MNLSRLIQLNPYLVSAALIVALFFNGTAIPYLAVSLILLLAWYTNNGILNYQAGIKTGKMLLPVIIILFWLWLGINILFSQITYLSILNFWWVGALPISFLGYSISPDKDRFWVKLFPLLIALGLGLSGYALYQFFILHGQPRATFLTKNSLAALLNLLIFPLLGIYLSRRVSRLTLLTTFSIFLFIFLLGIIQSRGAWLGFATGLVILFSLGFSRDHSQRWLRVTFIIAMAVICAALVFRISPETGSGLIEQVITLQDAASAGHTRYVIWEPVVQLLLQYPWTGSGLGTYFMAIPPLLHPQDHSAHFYVHNDYLQIVLETGLPGLLLLLAIFTVVLWLFVKGIQNSKRGNPLRTEFIAVLAGIVSIAVHSVFTFNLYVMPSMLITGLLLGRFNQISNQLMSNTGRVIFLHKQKPHIYYFVLLLCSLILLQYFARLGVGSYYLEKGQHLVSESQIEKAHHAFVLAQKLIPPVDSPWYEDADLMRNSALVIHEHPQQSRHLLDEAEVKVKRAIQLNPLRPQAYYILGKIYEQRKSSDSSSSIQAYKYALQLDPRYLPARVALAQILQKHGHQAASVETLYAGLAYTYRGFNQTFLEYLELTAGIARDVGDSELATQLTTRLSDYKHKQSTNSNSK